MSKIKGYTMEEAEQIAKDRALEEILNGTTVNVMRIRLCVAVTREGTEDE